MLNPYLTHYTSLVFVGITQHCCSAFSIPRFILRCANSDKCTRAWHWCWGIKQHTYRVNPENREKLCSEVEFILEHDVATIWGVLPVLVPTADGSLRFCYGFQKLNDVTKRNSYPLPSGWWLCWRYYVQWGEQVFDTLPILQVFLLTKHVEVCNFYHRYILTVRDRIGKKTQKITLYDF